MKIAGDAVKQNEAIPAVLRAVAFAENACDELKGLLDTKANLIESVERLQLLWRISPSFAKAWVKCSTGKAAPAASSTTRCWKNLLRSQPNSRRRWNFLITTLGFIFQAFQHDDHAPFGL